MVCQRDANAGQQRGFADLLPSVEWQVRPRCGGIVHCADGLAVEPDAPVADVEVEGRWQFLAIAEDEAVCDGAEFRRYLQLAIERVVEFWIVRLGGQFCACSTGGPWGPTADGRGPRPGMPPKGRTKRISAGANVAEQAQAGHQREHSCGCAGVGVHCPAPWVGSVREERPPKGAY